MTESAIHPQKGRIITVIDSIGQDDARPRAHTRTRNAVSTDIDRIEAARLAALRLTYRLNNGDAAGWVHYCDSVGGIHGEYA